MERPDYCPAVNYGNSVKRRDKFVFTLRSDNLKCVSTQPFPCQKIVRRVRWGKKLSDGLLGDRTIMAPSLYQRIGGIRELCCSSRNDQTLPAASRGI